MVEVASPMHKPLIDKSDRSRLGQDDFVLQPQKRTNFFGYWPMWSECVPLHDTGQVDWAGAFANIGAGFVIGVREALGGIVSASLIFSTSDIPEVVGMFPFGIGMMWYSTSLGALWYAIFGRVQYVYGTAQDVIGILQAVMVKQVAWELLSADKRDQIPATALAVIWLSSIFTGICSFAIGKCGLGKLAMTFPAPVTSGFLGAIGCVILRSSLQTSSGVNFKTFYPVDMEKFLQPSTLWLIFLQVSTVFFIRFGPPVIECVGGEKRMKKISGIICQLFPWFLFWVVVYCAGISKDTLTEQGWIYPKAKSGGIAAIWTRYHLRDVDTAALLNVMVQMPPLILMALLCTATGALTVTDHFPRHPPGDSSPLEAVNFDRELTTVGVSSTLLGMTGGTLTFHTFTSIQLRLDGGTHRIAVLSMIVVIFGAFLSDYPIGHYVPKWYLSGLFMNTAIHFLKGALMSYQSYTSMGPSKLPPPQYVITLVAIVTAIFSSPSSSIFAGVVLSVFLFLFEAARASPVRNAVEGDRVISRTKRPSWELHTLVREGKRIVLLYLEGPLFFGSTRKLVGVLSAAIAPKEVGYKVLEVEFCILSFARVTVVDPSALRHLKNMQEKAKLTGCRILCCRAKHSVFDALCAAKLIETPDPDLIKYLKGEKWVTREKSKHPGQEGMPVRRKLTETFETMAALAPLENADPDAFAHETDALDYCNEQIVAHYFYNDLGSKLEAHQKAYREALSSGARLPEWAFEDMWGLARGTMDCLREYVEIIEPGQRKDVKHLTEEGNLGFIFRGAVSLVQILPIVDQHKLWGSDVRGFNFREGKRLRRRYPAGHVVGKVNFFLKPRGLQVGDEGHKVVISSKLSYHGTSAEIWILRRRQWDEIPSDLKVSLTGMLCTMLADDAQHNELQEH